MIAFLDNGADALAFNLGSDARLEGKSPQANPYQVGASEFWNWERGWCHVDTQWGVGVGERWKVKPLPFVSHY
jgi:hypothetical protein